MRRRRTARVLLLDAADRLLLLRGRLGGPGPAAPFWFTVGGGLEPGEGVRAAALREIREETGLADIRLGPVVLRREAVVPDMATGEPLLNDETYLAARAGDGDLARDGWSDVERRLIDAARWWTLEELAASKEPFYPPDLTRFFADAIALEPAAFQPVVPAVREDG